MSIKKETVFICMTILFLIGITGCRTAGPLSFAPISTPLSFVSITGGRQAPQSLENATMNIAIATESKGCGVIYNTLLKEAAQKGADAIVNVSIFSTGFFNKT
jgi:predicted small lipoprotein YifL